MTEGYKSKYFNLNKWNSVVHKNGGWSEEDFAMAVERLETMPIDKLRTICVLPEINLKFSKVEELYREQILLALFKEYPKDLILLAIQKVS